MSNNKLIAEFMGLPLVPCSIGTENGIVYEGYRYDRPVTLVAGCINNDKTRDILQKELFGDPMELDADLGTGWIPKDCIGKVMKKRGS